MKSLGAWIKPKALREGDLVGIAAPSGAVDVALLKKGASELESLGFKVRPFDGTGGRHLFAAGTKERRLSELFDLFSDDEVKGIFCARGGAGAAALLEDLEQKPLPLSPKVFVGYSDVTFLHLHLQKAGLVTFYGPMVARELARGSYDRDSLLRAVQGGMDPFCTEADDLLPIREGAGRGRLLGGCLSILAASAGTPWAGTPSPEPTLLFLEDQDEPPYRIDRMLRQLRASGAFVGVSGIVFGDMKGCAPPLSADFTLEDVILDVLGDLGVPIAIGLSAGHASGPAVTLPLGVMGRLHCGKEARLEVTEVAVL